MGSREGASEASASSQPERNRAEEDVSRGAPLSSPRGPTLVSSCPRRTAAEEDLVHPSRHGHAVV